MRDVLVARLRKARLVRDPCPTLLAFTLLERTRYCDVVDPEAFERRADYRQQQRAPWEVRSDDQLCVDMQACKADYRGIASVLRFLRGGEGAERPLHCIIERQAYRARNECVGWWERLAQPWLHGHYYKILVDFGQSQ